MPPRYRHVATRHSRQGRVNSQLKLVATVLRYDTLRCVTIRHTRHATLRQAERVNSQLKLIIRPMYSSPPIHGALIVNEVLGDDDLRAQYYTECEGMANRILSVRCTSHGR